MHVLLTGANGFIGRYILGALLAAGHHVVPAVRRPDEIDRLLPMPAAIRVDMNRDIRPEDWQHRLDGIDAVINCAGVLQGRPGQSIEAIHEAAPKALFEACLWLIFGGLGFAITGGLPSRDGLGSFRRAY
jgi:uncharacterized protein YbjT (DUF2867 family)